MSAKPGTPITRKEMYLDVMTGGSSNLPEPVAIEEKYLAKIAGMTVDLPAPVPLKHKFLAKIAGMTVNVPTYTTDLPRIYAYFAKAAGQDVDVPQPITREEMYWFDYVSGQPAPPEREYTGAVPVTFTANGQPLLDYLISGNTVQNGTPSPDSPIQPQECGERTGNLFDIKTFQDGIHLDITTGLPTPFGGNRIATMQPIDVSQYNNVTVTYDEISHRATFMYSIFNGDTLIERVANKKSGDAIDTSNATKMYLSLYPCIVSDVIYIMGNAGSTTLPYEPYGIKIPILSANTTTPVYLGEVQTTRKIKKLVLTGTEDWTTITRPKYTYATSITPFLNNSAAISSHFKRAPMLLTLANKTFTLSNNMIHIKYNDKTSVDDFKQFLAAQYANGTPVTVWYVLANEKTGIVNEPLMKIGDYADTVSMEQAGVSIPTANGNNTLDVLTAVKPSEVYIKYKGEPVAGSQTSSLSSAYAPAEVSGQGESVDDINNSLLGKEEETK